VRGAVVRDVEENVVLLNLKSSAFMLFDGGEEGSHKSSGKGNDQKCFER